MKINFFLKAFSLVTAAFIFQSCGTTAAQKSVDAKVNAEPTMTQQQANRSNEELIRTAPNLTDEQRAQLQQLRISSEEKSKAIEDQSMKLREVLMKDLLSPNYDAKKSAEVRTIRSKMAKLQRQRMRLTFDNVEKAQRILGRQAKDNEVLMNNFLERDFDRRGAF